MAAPERCILPVDSEVSPCQSPDIGGGEVIVTKQRAHYRVTAGARGPRDVDIDSKVTQVSLPNGVGIGLPLSLATTSRSTVLSCTLFSKGCARPRQSLQTSDAS